MLESPRGLRLIVLAAIVMCIVASLTGAKAGEDKQGLRIAIVDMQKLGDEITLIKNAREDADKQAKDLDTEFRIARRNPLLAEADQKTLIDLANKERVTPNGLSKADQDRQKALQDQSNALNEDYQKLQNTPVGAVDANAEKKLKDYNRLATETEVRLKAHQDQASKELESKAQQINQQVQENMKKALGDVAKKSGYNLVLSSQVAPYAEFDCTKDVLSILNKKP